MSINDIPLGRLKEILASDMPLTIVTTEALITRPCHVPPGGAWCLAKKLLMLCGHWVRRLYS